MSKDLDVKENELPEEWMEILDRLDRIIEMLGEISLSQNSYVTYYAASQSAEIDLSKVLDTILESDRCTCGDETTAVCPIHGYR